MRALPLLNRCDAPIARVGDTWIWACDKCRKPVHDLSRLSEGHAADWLRDNAGARKCLKYTTDRSGNIVFAAMVAAISATACSAADLESAMTKLQGVPSAPQVFDAGAEVPMMMYGFIGADDPVVIGPAPSVHAHCNAGVPPKR